MADYNVGNIEIGIVTNSNEVIKGLDRTIAKLKEFKKIDKNLQNIFLRVNQLGNGLTRISKIDLGVLNSKIAGVSKATENFVTALASVNQPNFQETAQALNRLGNAFRQFDKLKDFDFRAMYQSFNSLNRILDPFLQKLKDSETSLKAMADVLNNLKAKAITKAGKEIDKADREAKKLKKTTDSINFDKIFNLGRLYFLYNYSRRTIRALGQVMASAINFNETLNKFQVSMGKYYQQSLKFVNNLTTAFNLSTESIMNYQSTFKNMLDALGNLGGNQTYQLSETLTRMAIDYASLFNVSIDRAMEQFQSVLSGQIRSIRSTSGYDVSEASIFSIYQSLGGKKTMRQLDQVEKRLLRIIAIQQQMSKTGAVGDFEKTINTSANQLKQIAETLKEIARWFGQLTMVYVQPFLEKVLSATIVLREMLKALNIAKGYKLPEFGEGGQFENTKKEAEEAEEAIQELKNSMLGYDRLNVLGSSGQGSSKVAEYQMLLDTIAKYKGKLTEVNNKANAIAESILTWLGYTKEENQWILQSNSNLSKITTTLKVMGSIIASIGIQKIMAGVVAKGDTILTGTKGLLTVLSGINPVLTAILVIFGTLYLTNEQFRESFNGLLGSIMDVLLPLIETIVGIIDSFAPVIDLMLKGIADALIPIIDSLTPIISLIGQLVEALQPIMIFIADLVSGILQGALANLNLVIQEILAVVQLITVAVSSLLQVGIGTMISQIEVIIGVFNTLKETLKAISETFMALFSGNVDKIGEIWEELGEKLKSIWTNVWDSIKGVFASVINGIIKAFSSFVNAFANKINDITKTLSGAWTWMGIPPIPKIPTWNPKPIKLAKGGVLDEPTYALMGEYAGAKSNPEIVTPENLMRKVFAESLMPMVQAIISGDKEVINAIGDLADRPINLNGRKVSENIYNDLQNVARRKGKILFGNN